MAHVHSLHWVPQHCHRFFTLPYIFQSIPLLVTKNVDYKTGMKCWGCYIHYGSELRVRERVGDRKRDTDTDREKEREKEGEKEGERRRRRRTKTT